MRAAPPLLPPRVLLVMPDQWPRALLRGALREVGYDAVGTRSLDAAAKIPARESARAPVGLVVVDQNALAHQNPAKVDALLEQLGHPRTLLVAPASLPADERRWSRVARRPLSVDDLVHEVEHVLPRPVNRPMD